MFKKSYLGLAVSALIAVPVVVQAEVEVTAVLKNETAAFIKDGMRTGEATSTTDTSGEGTGLMKFENSARIFFNGDIGEASSWHGELNLVYDSEGVAGSDTHEVNTQNDWFRELYIDTQLAGFDVRLGKQQVVWGTADGIKLLDIINPTDFSELNQNTMEDSRIPIWMLNVERNVGENGNIQFIVAQAEENKIAGLNANGANDGQPFVFKGVDSITGPVNGFLNITPALANVAYNFGETARNGATLGGFGFDTTGDGVADNHAAGLTAFAGLTVAGFAGRNQFTDATGAVICANPLGCGAGVSTSNDGGGLLNNFAQNGQGFGLPFSNNNVVNLTTSAYDETVADTTFEYMANATFATFNTFSGNAATGVAAATSEYVRDYPDDTNPNMGFRFKNSTGGGLNYSLNYFYHYDANPAVNLSWHDAVTGEKLTTVLATNGAYADGYRADPNGNSGGATISRDQVPNAITTDANGNASNAVSVLLRNSAGEYYGAVDPNDQDATVSLNAAGNAAKLRFTETLNRIHSIGAAFDYAFDTKFSPVVIRAEFLYDKDTKQPIIDKRLLGIGDLEGGLVMEDTDMFKYVLGADITVLTDMMLSAQFIQYRNLDYVEDRRTCTTQVGTSYDCSKYTADFSTLHLSNGLNQSEKNKEFYSLFLSKPFGASDLGRVNNILIYEEGGGYWNRLDAEYSLSDQLVVTGELNMYWGDENTTFGQFENSSSIQVGLKYLIE